MPRTIWNHFHYTMILLHTSKCWLWSLEVWQFWQRCHLHEMEVFPRRAKFCQIVRRKLQLLRSNTSTRNAPRRCNPLRFQIYFFLFPPPQLFPLLMLSFQDLKHTLPGLRPFSHPRPRALVVVIVVLLPSSLSPSSYLPLSPSATSWNQMQQSQKEFDVHCHYAKVYSQKFWWGILIINASFKTYINVHFNAIAVLPLCHHPNILFYENTHIIWPLPYPSRLPRASSDVVPRDNEAGSNEQHCDRHHWTQEQAHILKVGIVPKSRNDSLSDETAKSRKQDLYLYGTFQV